MIHVFRGGNDEGGGSHQMKSPEPKGPHQRQIIHQSNRIAINLHNLQQVVAAAKGAGRAQKRESPIAREM